MRKIAMIAAAAALVSAPQLASAADLGGSMKDVPPPVMVTNWTGFYIGAGIGFGAVVDQYKLNIDTNWVPPHFTYNHDHWTTGGDGVLGTIQLGYDYQFPASRWVVGAFADYDWEHFSANRDNEVITLGGGAGAHHSITLQNQWNIGGRLGILSSPETLFYILLSYTQAQQKASVDFWPDAIPNILDQSGTATLSGLTVGAGLETHLKDNWFLKLEYRFSQLGSDNVWDSQLLPALATSNHYWAEVDADVHTARIVLTYKLAKQGYVEPMK
jgi:outer membrane immunogenic protein